MEKDGTISKVSSIPNVTKPTLKRKKRKRRMEERDSTENKKNRRDPFWKSLNHENKSNRPREQAAEAMGAWVQAMAVWGLVLAVLV